MLDFSNWVDVANVIGGFATAFAAALTVVGLPLVLLQIRASRAIEREATAKQLYREYLADCIERPDLVTPNLDQLIADGRFVQYELFVAHMLYSLEEILENTSASEWRDVAKGQLRRHLTYFRSEHFEPKRPYYSDSLLDLLDSIPDQDPFTTTPANG